MKKVIPLLAVVAVVCVAALFARQQTPGSPAAVSNSASSSQAPQEAPRGALNAVAPQSAPEAPKVVLVDSLLTKLAGQSIVVIDLLPRNLDLMFAPVFSLYSRLSQTKLWQRVKPDSMLAAGAEQASAGNPGLQMLTMFGGVPPEAKELWNALSEISLALSSKTVPVDANGKHFDVPALAVIAKFSSDENAKKYSSMITAQLQPLKDQAEMMGIQVTEPAPGTIDISGQVPGTTTTAVASLSMKTPHILLLIGSKDPLDFFEKKGSSPSAAVDLASRSWVPNTAIAFSAQYDALAKVAEQVVTNLMPPGQMNTAESEQIKKIFRMYSGTKMNVFTVGLDAGILRYQGCMDLAAGSIFEKAYSTMISRPDGSNLSSAGRLIDDQTLLTFDYPVALLLSSWDMMRDQSLSPSLTPEQRKGFEAIQKVNAVFDRFGFQKLTFVVAAPPAGPMPRAALLLTESKLSGEPLLNQLVESANEMVSYAQTMQGGGAPPVPVAKLVKTGGTPQVQIQAGMIQVLAQLAGDNSVVIGLDPYFLTSVSEKVKGKSAAPGVKLAQAKSDFESASQLIYLNTGVGFDLVRPWLNTMIPPGQSATPEEIAEVFDLFKTSIVSSQRVERPVGTLLCAYGATFQN